MPDAVNRRRALTILAAGAGLLLAPASPGAARARRFEWSGTAMGADARIILYHPDRRPATEALGAAVAEIDRLENAFSLYREGSELSRLNANGVLEAPSHDMRRLLALSMRFGELSGGAFDVTVQPLWRLHADHFAAHPEDRTGPDPTAVAAARSLVDYRRIRMAGDRVSLPPGAAVTFNGIGQGYVTDRVADRLRALGWSDVMVHLGETLGLGGRADGSPWRAAVPGAGGGGLLVRPLRDRAMATSAGAGTRFEPTGRHHHLFDPRTGTSAARFRQVTVIARDATTADALSTALFVTPGGDVGGLFRRARGIEAWLTTRAGRVRHLEG